MLKIRPKEKAAVATDQKDIFDNFDELDTIKNAKNIIKEKLGEDYEDFKNEDYDKL